jgi:solute carrier family 25 protein 34/35
VQLPSYNLGKSLLVQYGWADNSFATYLVASMVSGVSVCAAMQPADTVLTRMYNRESYMTP